MIIDAHTHIGKKHVIATAKELVDSMKEAGVDKSLVFAGKLNESSTFDLLTDIRQYKNSKLYAIGSVSPLAPGECAPSNCEHFSNFMQYLSDLLSDEEIYGLKFYPGYEHFYPTDEELIPYLELLVQHNKPAIFHSGDCFNGVCGAKLKYAHPLQFDELAVDMPKLKIVIAHMGYPWIRDAAEVCYKNANVYADTSGFVYGGFTDKDALNFKDIIQEFITISGGTQKLIFGTDWPISSQQSYVSNITNIFQEQLGITIEEYNKIMGGRASELFGV